MISVGIRELKSHLSQYIDLVKCGENVLITEHSKVVAEIRIPEKNIASDGNIENIFKTLESEGKLIPAKRNPSILNKSKISKQNKKLKNEWWAIYQDSKKDKF